MRKYFLALALLALALPVAGLAGPRAGEGTLTVEDGRGTVSVQARGGVIGRLESGSITIWDLTPDDANDPFVVGDDKPVRFIGETGIKRSGTGIRFRLVGGGFRIQITGKGIDLSVVGRGNGWIKGDAIEPGLYSLDGSDCRKPASTCVPLPEFRKHFLLGTPVRSETP